MPRIIYYRNKCIGCNACVEAAYSRWRMSRKDGKSVLVGGINKKGVYNVKINDDEVAANKLAAAGCPPRIIKITDT